MAFGRNCEYASVADCIQDQTGKVSNPAEFCENLRRETESQCEQAHVQNPQAAPKSGQQSQRMGGASKAGATPSQAPRTGPAGQTTTDRYDDTDPNQRQQEQYKRDNETQPNTRREF